MKNLVAVALLVMFSSLLQAQDLHLTQYYTSNLSLNPACTGNFNGDVRGVLNYRSQWKQVVEPITTAMFSLEKKLTHFSHSFGLGFIAMNDRLTTYGLQSNKLYLSGSYAKKIGKNILGFGVQGGYVMRSTNLADQTFPGQWEYSTGTYNTSIDNNENQLQSTKSYLDFNLGASYSRLLKNKTLTVGYALFNVNKPTYGYVSSGDTKLPFRHVLNSTINLPLNASLQLKPHLLYMTTTGATDFILGTNAIQKLNADLALLLGLAFRGGTVNSDAAMAVIGANYKRIEFGFSFDFNMSTLSKDTPRKSVWEISLVYTTPSRNIPKSTINCDRY